MKRFHFLRSIVFAIAIVGLAACANTPPAPTAAAGDLKQMTLSAVRHRAAHGDVAAEVELARRYGTGTGVKKDYAKAFELAWGPAQAGDATAEFYIGTAYETGAGAEKDESRAVIWYGKAVDQQQPDAAYSLAKMIIEGRGGISPTWSGAIPLLRIAAEQDRPYAQILLGNAYATGAGIDKDPEQGATWYRRAMAVMKENDKPASVRLRILIDKGEVKWQPGDPGEPPSQTAKDPTSTAP